MYAVYLVYASIELADHYATFDEAVKAAMECGFECSIHGKGMVLAYYSKKTGLIDHRGDVK